MVGEVLRRPVDVVLYDTFGRPDDAVSGVKRLLDTAGVGQVALYTGAPRPAQVATALDAGASAVLSKARPATSLVEALERIHRGERVVDGTGGHQPVPWPGVLARADRPAVRGRGPAAAGAVQRGDRRCRCSSTSTP